MTVVTFWTLPEAVTVAKAVEGVCPAFGCHVALTGGTLYKDGGRKDLDLLFYRIRQAPEIRRPQLLEALKSIGFSEIRTFGWMNKATILGKNVDIFFPEHVDVAGEEGSYVC